jgi:hypothetical protein
MQTMEIQDSKLISKIIHLLIRNFVDFFYVGKNLKNVMQMQLNSF